jgi:hypothetical protein
MAETLDDEAMAETSDDEAMADISEDAWSSDTSIQCAQAERHHGALG